MLCNPAGPPLASRWAPIPSSSQTQLAASDAAIEERAAGLAERAQDRAVDASALRDLIRSMDLTSLEGTENEAMARELCKKAIRPNPKDPRVPSVAAVCVYPVLIAECKRALAGSAVRVASVAGAFPSGRARLEVKLDEVRAAIDLGADEIDVVIDHQAFIAGEEDTITEEIARIKQLIGALRLKVILETGQLGSWTKVRRASELALAAGADYLKTSTGKTHPAATPGATLVMLEAIARHHASTGLKVGIKPAGGIRTAHQALLYATLVEQTLGNEWLTPELFRLGASALLDDVLTQLTLLAHGE